MTCKNVSIAYNVLVTKYVTILKDMKNIEFFLCYTLCGECASASFNLQCLELFDIVTTQIDQNPISVIRLFK